MNILTIFYYTLNIKKNKRMKPNSNKSFVVKLCYGREKYMIL